RPGPGQGGRELHQVALLQARLGPMPLGRARTLLGRGRTLLGRGRTRRRGGEPAGERENADTAALGAPTPGACSNRCSLCRHLVLRAGRRPSPYVLGRGRCATAPPRGWLRLARAAVAISRGSPTSRCPLGADSARGRPTWDGAGARGFAGAARGRPTWDGAGAR